MCWCTTYNPKEADRQRQERQKWLEALQVELKGLWQLRNEAHIKRHAVCVLILPTGNIYAN